MRDQLRRSSLDSVIACERLAGAWRDAHGGFDFHHAGYRGRLEDETELAIVAGADRIINPELEKWYYARAHSHTVTLEGARHSA